MERRSRSAWCLRSRFGERGHAACDAARRIAAVVLCVPGLAGCASEAVAIGRIDSDSGTAGSGDAGQGTGAGGAGAAGIGGAGPDMCDLPVPIHRYSFDGVGLQVTDSIGAADGELLAGAAQLDGTGSLTLDGESYVNLPNHLVSVHSSVSVALWVESASRKAYVRLFDFGLGTAGGDPLSGPNYRGRQYLAATPSTGFVPAGLAALVSEDGGETAAPSAVDIADRQHFVVVSLRSSESLSLYDDGALVTRVPVSTKLADIDDVNNWLGRSQYEQDPGFEGTYEELRIYAPALEDCAVARAAALGPRVTQ